MRSERQPAMQAWSEHDLDQFAVRQLADYDRRMPGTLFAAGMELSEAQAYAIQAKVAQLREQRGEVSIGYKVGCTSPAIQRQMRTDHPVYARLWDTERHASGTQLRLSDFASPAIEGELAVLLRADISEPTSTEALTEAIDSIFPVIELHNALFRRLKPSVEELVANNAIHAGIVEAASRQPFVMQADAGIEIRLGDQCADSYEGPELTETVLRSLRWLTSALARDAVSLKAGQIILTGTVTKLIPVSAPTTIVVETSHFGRVEACFVES